MHDDTCPPDSARVLVAVVNRWRDLRLARDEHCYRIPLARAPERLGADYLALYQTGAFGPGARWQVRWYAPVLRYRVAQRIDLLPEEASHPRAMQHYYCLELGMLSELPRAVPAARLRRITFIATSFGQLRRAQDVCELWHPPEASAELPAMVWGAGLAGQRLRERSTTYAGRSA